VTVLLAYLALVVAVAALCCGHQGEPFPPLAWWRAAKDAGRASAWLSARLRPEGGAGGAREGRSASRAPQGESETSGGVAT
jgi:hypothetical protein